MLWWLLVGVVAAGLLVWLVLGLRRAGRVIDNMPQPRREAARVDRSADGPLGRSPGDRGTGVA